MWGFISAHNSWVSSWCKHESLSVCCIFAQITPFQLLPDQTSNLTPALKRNKLVLISIKGWLTWPSALHEGTSTAVTSSSHRSHQGRSMQKPAAQNKIQSLSYSPGTHGNGLMNLGNSVQGRAGGQRLWASVRTWARGHYNAINIYCNYISNCTQGDDFYFFCARYKRWISVYLLSITNISKMTKPSRHSRYPIYR